MQNNFVETRNLCSNHPEITVREETPNCHYSALCQSVIVCRTLLFWYSDFPSNLDFPKARLFPLCIVSDGPITINLASSLVYWQLPNKDQVRFWPGCLKKMRRGVVKLRRAGWGGGGARSALFCNVVFPKSCSLNLLHSGEVFRFFKSHIPRPLPHVLT